MASFMIFDPCFFRHEKDKLSRKRFKSINSLLGERWGFNFRKSSNKNCIVSDLDTFLKWHLSMSCSSGPLVGYVGPNLTHSELLLQYVYYVHVV